MSRSRKLWAWLVAAALLSPAVASAAGLEDKLSMEQMKKTAEEMIANMRGMRENGESSLRQARADKDVGRMDCVNEALIALKGVLKLGEDYLYDLQAEYKLGNAKGVEAAFQKVKLAAKKIDDLDARLRSCGGPAEEGVVEGKPVIERVTDSDLPNVDPLAGLEGDELYVDQPPVASPYE